MITVYQNNGTTVTPLADARLYQLLSGGAVGVVLGCEVTSLGANQIRVGAGWILILGRCIEVTEETILATTSTSGAVNGRLLLHLDVSNTETPATWVTQAQTPLPALTQEDINGSGTIYEMAMATYKVDQLQVTELQTTFPTVVPPPSFFYKATFLLDGWTGEAAPYTQTVPVIPVMTGAPVVTEKSIMTSAVTIDDTIQGEARAALLAAASLVDGGTKTFGAGTITCVLQEGKPDADAEVFFNAMQGGVS